LKAAYEHDAGQPTCLPCRPEILFSPTQVKPWIESCGAIGNELLDCKVRYRHVATGAIPEEEAGPPWDRSWLHGNSSISM
jgi:hypothetical protein